MLAKSSSVTKNLSHDANNSAKIESYKLSSVSFERMCDAYSLFLFRSFLLKMFTEH